LNTEDKEEIVVVNGKGRDTPRVIYNALKDEFFLDDDNFNIIEKESCSNRLPG
jgi:hypothetical protein